MIVNTNRAGMNGLGDCLNLGYEVKGTPMCRDNVTGSMVDCRVAACTQAPPTQPVLEYWQEPIYENIVDIPPPPPPVPVYSPSDLQYDPWPVAPYYPPSAPTAPYVAPTTGSGSGIYTIQPVYTPEDAAADMEDKGQDPHGYPPGYTETWAPMEALIPQNRDQQQVYNLQPLDPIYTQTWQHGAPASGPNTPGSNLLNAVAPQPLVLSVMPQGNVLIPPVTDKTVTPAAVSNTQNVSGPNVLTPGAGGNAAIGPTAPAFDLVGWAKDNMLIIGAVIGGFMLLNSGGRR